MADILSDKIGRRWTLMFVAILVTGTKGLATAAIVLVASLISFNYGTSLSLFPSFTSDLWSLKNFGLNYGV